MAAIVWISGASGGIGAALARTVPWEGARVLGISRGAPEGGVEHLAADLADPATWPRIGASFDELLGGFGSGPDDQVVFVHAAGSTDPMGFAAEVDSAEYQRNVVLNSAAGQVLGQRFLAAARDVRASRHLVMLTSGAARSIYPGWTAYGAGKAALDQWVRDAGAEQELRGGVRVLSVGPGTVDTAMQARLRDTTETAFPGRQKFQDLYERGGLTDPQDVATRLWELVGKNLDNGSVVDLRTL